jgi:hypothetical protein
LSKILTTTLKNKGANDLKLIGLDQQFKVDIVVEKTTMLPQTLTITRLQKAEFVTPGPNPGFSEEITKTYTFAWILKQEDKKVSQ